MDDKENNTKKSDMKKKCFIITPIGSEGSDIRKKAEGVIDAVINPVLSSMDYDIYVPHKMNNPGSITGQIIDHILNDELVIANLTGLNANVMYELAVRHAARKPIVCIAENSTKLPFDVMTDRVIFYDDAMYSVEATKQDLSKKIAAATSQEKIDNPIYRSMSDKIILEKIDKGNDKDASAAYKYLIERLDRMERLFSYPPARSVIIPEREMKNNGKFPTLARISFDKIDDIVTKRRIAAYVRKKYAASGIMIHEISFDSTSNKDTLSILSGDIDGVGVEMLESLVDELGLKYSLKNAGYVIVK